MATSLTFNTYEKDDHTSLIENYHYLSERRCLKQHLRHTPLALRRSVSLEDNSTDHDNKSLEKPKEQYSTNLSPSNNSQLSSSLNSLCLKLRPYQLLPEYHEDIAKSVNEHEYNWWKTAAHLVPIFQRVITIQNQDIYDAPETYKNDEGINFKICKRQGRRNAVCIGIDRLYYNDQMLLFATIAGEVQMDYNLMSSGFKM